MASNCFRIKVQNDHEGGHIYSPLVVIEYGELKKQDIQENREIKVDYKVIFLLTNKNSNKSIEVNPSSHFIINLLQSE